MTEASEKIEMNVTGTRQHTWLAALDRPLILMLLAFAIAPLVLKGYVVGELTRAMIYGMAACAVGFAIRHGGLVSFGHAAFFGLGAYSVLIARDSGFVDAHLIWPLALVFIALVALLIGSLSLRTNGVAFIMITLGFAQMVYFIISSNQALGAADGIAISARDRLAGLSLESTQGFHYLTLAVLLLVVFLMHRISHSPAGLALRGVAHDERRMRALGYAPKRLQLAVFVFSAVVTGFAGVLAANYYHFASPAYLHWTVSGEFLVMVALGGIGSLSGGLFGSVALILFEAVVSQYTTYWRIFLGPVVILSVLYLQHGLQPSIARLLGDAR